MEPPLQRQASLRLNIGCGMTPTAGWANYDNSFSVKLAENKLLAGVMGAAGLIDGPQAQFIAFCRSNGVKWADAARRIPHDDASVDAIYSSHMFEHLEPAQAEAFLREARRVLKPGGVLRLAVPDLSYHIANYRSGGDADRFIRETHMVVEDPRGLRRTLAFLLVGQRNHKWMYDGASLCARLAQCGFPGAKVMPPGETTIPDPGALDLHERVPESVFVEAIRPT